MISAHSLTQRIRRSHRRPLQRRSHHNEELRPAIRVAGRGAFFAACPPDAEGVERVVVIPDRPRLFWPAPPPEGYLGQLDELFQKRLAGERAIIEREDCRFTETSLLTSGEVVEGEWDFRGREEPYLGAVPLSGARVLHLAPGGGYFTFHMERHGAEVAAFDVGWEAVPDVMAEPGVGGGLHATPSGAVTFHAHAALRERSSVQNAWWYLHRDYGSRAAMVYGDFSRLPSDMGAFDVAVLGDVLARVRDPWGLLAQVAAVTRGTVVVTDRLIPAISEGSRAMRDHAVVYAPNGPDDRNTWWAMAPGAVIDALANVGLSRTRLIYHSQRRKVGDVWSDAPMFTVVAERDWAL